jgi:hypothetical protein
LDGDRAGHHVTPSWLGQGPGQGPGGPTDARTHAVAAATGSGSAQPCPVPVRGQLLGELRQNLNHSTLHPPASCTSCLVNPNKPAQPFTQLNPSPSLTLHTVQPDPPASCTSSWRRSSGTAGGGCARARVCVCVCWGGGGQGGGVALGEGGAAHSASTPRCTRAPPSPHPIPCSTPPPSAHP